MIVLMNRWFKKWVKSQEINPSALLQARQEIENGLIDAQIGKYLIKKRIGTLHKGKSGGYRVIIAYKSNKRMIFIYGFAKNDTGNINQNQKNALEKLASEYMQLSDFEVDIALENQQFYRIDSNG